MMNTDNLRKMKKLILGIFILFFLLLLNIPSAVAATYTLADAGWGIYQDADKDRVDDGNMCWAASASNVLTWGGYHEVDGQSFSDEEDVFDYFVDKWPNEGNSGFASAESWQWWLYATVPDDGPPVPASGGGFWPDANWSRIYRNFDDEIKELGDLAKAMDALDNRFLRQNYGTTIDILGTGLEGHSLTAWGVEYHMDGETTVYDGIYYTDSGDAGDAPLKYTAVALEEYDEPADLRWRLLDLPEPEHRWNIFNIEGLAPTPEPTTLFILGPALLGIFGLLRKRKNK